MSTGKRLAKRSIIGTRVCAPGPDGLWYSGVIQDVKTPPPVLAQTPSSTPSKHQQRENTNCINLTPNTKYLVRFDLKTQQKVDNYIDNNNSIMATNHNFNYNNNNLSAIQNNNHNANANLSHISHHQSVIQSPAQSVRRNAMIKEFRENELIGPGFRSIIGIQLHPGQRVFITHNGREVSGDVIHHDMQKDEVVIRIMQIGYEEPLELKKRLEEVRLLESRRSARLADQERDTDFARLADMAGDRRRPSHNIDVPLALTQHNSRKRRPSYSHDERDNHIPQFRDDDQMNACNAALVLMSLSCSPHSPQAGQWNTMLGSSPGSSSASCSSSGSSSPPLSDDGTPSSDTQTRIRTTSLSTSDEGIVMDYSDETPRKRRAHGPIFQCTWKGCGVIETTVPKIESHVRTAHLPHKQPRNSIEDDDSDHEEEFYYTEIEDEGRAPSPPSPPTLSHRDMARPPHEDPEYQRQMMNSLNCRQGIRLLASQNGSIKPSLGVNIPTSPLAHHNYTWTQQSPVSPQKHARWSPRPSTSSAPYPSPTYVQQHYNTHNIQPNVVNIVHHTPTITNLSHSAPTSSTVAINSNVQTNQHHHPQPQITTAPHLQSPIQSNRIPQSPNRRTRGENKKCRKVYGMDKKDQWCTQCKWKKACSRFGD